MKHSNSFSRLTRTTSGIFLSLFFSAQVVMADELILQPSSVALAAKSPTASVKLTNSGADSKIVRIEVMSYSNENGREKMLPSTRLIVHPNQVNLKSGASEIVKVGMRMSGPLWEPENYRLVLTEVPQSPDVGKIHTSSWKNPGTKQAMLPVSVLPPGQSLSSR